MAAGSHGAGRHDHPLGCGPVPPGQRSRRTDQRFRAADPEPGGGPAAERLDQHSLRGHRDKRRLPAVTAVGHRPGSPVSRRAWVRREVMGMPISIHIRGGQVDGNPVRQAVEEAFDTLREADVLFSASGWTARSAASAEVT